MDASWAQWILGAALGVTQLVVGWVGHRLFELFKELYKLKERIAILEGKPYIDPVENAKAMISLAGAITRLTEQLATNDRHRTEQIADLQRAIARLQEDFEDLSKRLDKGGLGL